MSSSSPWGAALAAAEGRVTTTLKERSGTADVRRTDEGLQAVVRAVHVKIQAELRTGQRVTPSL